jgi:hypothetical protein
MNSRQVQYDVNSGGNPVDADLARAEAAKADGVLPLGWSIIPTNDLTQANMVRNQEAKAEIERMGPTPAVLGRQEAGSQSGRARLVSQQAGLTELARPIGRLNNWELRVYRQMWARARQFWTDEMFIRISDDVRAPEWLKVNEPQLGMVMQPVADPATGQPAIDQTTGQPMMRPAMGVVGYNNRLAEMDVDIILDTVQDTATLAQEVWAELVQLVGQAGGLEAVYSPAFELMIEASPMADKTRVIELIKKGRDEQQQNQVAQLSQQVQQLTQALQEKQQQTSEQVAADVAHKTGQATLAQAKAQQIGVETEKSALDALMPNHLEQEDTD